MTKLTGKEAHPARHGGQSGSEVGAFIGPSMGDICAALDIAMDAARPVRSYGIEAVLPKLELAAYYRDNFVNAARVTRAYRWLEKQELFREARKKFRRQCTSPRATEDLRSPQAEALFTAIVLEALMYVVYEGDGTPHLSKRLIKRTRTCIGKFDRLREQLDVAQIASWPALKRSLQAFAEEVAQCEKQQRTLRGGKRQPERLLTATLARRFEAFFGRTLRSVITPLSSMVAGADGVDERTVARRIKRAIG